MITIKLNDKEEMRILTALFSSTRNNTTTIKVFNKNTEFDKKFRKQRKEEIKLNEQITKKLRTSWKNANIGEWE